MIYDLITKRTSIRTYQNEALSDEDLTSIGELLIDINKQTGPNSTQVVFHLTTTDPNETGKVTGTYGFIKNAQAFIAGAIPNSSKNVEDYGYLMEKIIVALVEMNIGTCWLGGSFKRDDFKQTLQIQSGQIIPAVTPLGYPAEKRRGYEKAMRYAVKADNKKSWTDLFYIMDFKTPLTRDSLPESLRKLENAFESVRKGPSASNKQPWRLLLSPSDNKVHVFLYEDPGYSGNKLGFSMQRLDAGIAMYHFEAAAKESGYDGKWVFKEPDVEVPNEHHKYIMTYGW